MSSMSEETEQCSSALMLLATQAIEGARYIPITTVHQPSPPSNVTQVTSVSAPLNNVTTAPMHIPPPAITPEPQTIKTVHKGYQLVQQQLSPPAAKAHNPMSILIQGIQQQAHLDSLSRNLVTVTGTLHNTTTSGVGTNNMTPLLSAQTVNALRAASSHNGNVPVSVVNINQSRTVIKKSNLPKLKIPVPKVEEATDADLKIHRYQIQKEVKAEVPSPVESPVTMLPPCTVCGEKASGFHYGANTCQACKGFFRRCLLRKQAYCCTNVNKCMAKRGMRNGCAGCRYKKCIAAGMSKNAIKTGRYTHEKRTKDIEEVKKLELQLKMKDDGKLAQCAVERRKDLEKVIRTITTTHLEQVPRCILSEGVTQPKSSNSSQHLSRQEFLRLYQSTKVDSLNHTQFMARVLKSLDVVIKRLISFAKVLPGFKDLPLDDQIALIKSSVLEWWVLMYSQWHNTDGIVVTRPADVDLVICLEDLYLLCNNKQDIQSLYKVMAKVQGLELTFEEQAMVIALCVIIGDAEVSRVGRLIVSASEDYILEALDYLFQKNHDVKERTMARLMDIITCIRSMQTFTQEATSRLETDNRDLTRVSPMVNGGEESIRKILAETKTESFVSTSTAVA